MNKAQSSHFEMVDFLLSQICQEQVSLDFQVLKVDFLWPFLDNGDAIHLAEAEKVEKPLSISLAYILN